jgi:hypothetical protein
VNPNQFVGKEPIIPVWFRKKLPRLPKEFRKNIHGNGDGKFYEDWVELYKIDFLGA